MNSGPQFCERKKLRRGKNLATLFKQGCRSRPLLTFPDTAPTPSRRLRPPTHSLRPRVVLELLLVVVVVIILLVLLHSSPSYYSSSSNLSYYYYSSSYSYLKNQSKLR